MFTTGFLILLLAESMATCKAQQRKENTVGVFHQNFLGYNQKGILESCTLKDLKNCSPPSTSEKKYSENCKDLGYKTFQCECNKYLCEKQIRVDSQDNTAESFTGYDLSGKKRTCQEKKPNIFCSQSIEPSDEFAFRCKKLGHTAFTCGCHDHLCSENISDLE